MARHRQKDEEAGAEGCGVLNTRKRMWKDAEGNIVTKKPTLNEGHSSRSHRSNSHDSVPLGSALSDFASYQNERGAPISPPISHDPSLGPSSLDDHDSGIALGYPLDSNTLSNSDSLSPIDQRLWPSSLTSTDPEPLAPAAFDDAPFDDIFNPDTASSFNNPFTTMSNYNWLFDLDLSRQEPLQTGGFMQESFPAFNFNGSTVNQPSHAFDLQLDHMTNDRSLSVTGQNGSLPSHRTDSPQHTSQASPCVSMISPPLTDETLQKASHKPSMQSQPPPAYTEVPPVLPLANNSQAPFDMERPLSMLQPSRSLPIIDELARQQVLDLIDITQPTAPDGSLVMRDHPLLSLSSLQTYCDLFFTRFNSVYPLIHMSTFDPSHVDTLLLVSVLLLGATYGEKDAHQVAVSLPYTMNNVS